MQDKALRALAQYQKETGRTLSADERVIFTKAFSMGAEQIVSDAEKILKKVG